MKYLLTFLRIINKGNKFCKLDDVYTVQDNFYDFYAEFFDVDILEPIGDILAINQEVWKKMYTNFIEKYK